MSERRVDAIIIYSTSVSQEHHRQFKKFGVPIVLVNNQATEENENSIYHDDQFGNRQLTRHLIELVHKRIGYLGNALAGRTTEDRLAGFKEEWKLLHSAANARSLGAYTTEASDLPTLKAVLDQAITTVIVIETGSNKAKAKCYL